MTNLTLTCPHCGGDQFIQPDNASLESQVTCNVCSTTFAASDLAKLNAVKEAERLASELARAAFGKMLK